jgi:hypothetical protein
MKSATILDVLRAVTRVAGGHREVEAWWYAPPQRLRVDGGAPPGSDSGPPEVAVDAAVGADVDHDLLARELGDLLRVPRVRVRRYQGSAEPRALFRLVTTRRET